ncbi:MAG: hypothetical protein M3Z09_16240 [Acidobacteriota bacterium]|nr:hypothetical protein [Acidobacteriota bacterium]
MERLRFEPIYLGNHAVKQLRQINFNRQNGILAQRAGLPFNPAYNPNIAGSVPFPSSRTA